MLGFAGLGGGRLGDTWERELRSVGLCESGCERLILISGCIAFALEPRSTVARLGYQKLFETYPGARRTMQAQRSHQDGQYCAGMKIVKAVTFKQLHVGE